MKLENVIYCGDNKIWLKKFPDKFVDLIYLDPPFFKINTIYCENISYKNMLYEISSPLIKGVHANV